MEILCDTSDDTKTQEAKEWVDRFLSIETVELERWFLYITKEDIKNVNYVTFHGSKGREFDNLIIALTNDFNRKKDYFREYFKNESEENPEICKKRNLLYVAVTRAKKNLYIIYQEDQFESVKDEFEGIFGKSTSI